MLIFITVGCKLKCTHGSPNEDCDACKCDGDWTGDKCGGFELFPIQFEFRQVCFANQAENSAAPFDTLKPSTSRSQQIVALFNSRNLDISQTQVSKFRQFVLFLNNKPQIFQLQASKFVQFFCQEQSAVTNLFHNAYVTAI